MINQIAFPKYPPKYTQIYYQNNKEKWKKFNRRPEYIKNKKEHFNKIYMRDKKILHSLKINGCAICGYDKCDRALHFHHVNPKDKKFQIITINLQRKDKDVIDEINKCILFCCRCHMELEN